MRDPGKRAPFTGLARAIFVGSVQEYRALPRVLAAMGRTDNKWELILVGDGPALPDVRSAANQHGVKLTVFPPVAAEELDSYLVTATVGLGSFSSLPVERYQLLTKLLDYLSVGLPYLTADSPASVELTAVTGGGVAIRPDNVDVLAAALSDLLKPERWRQLSETGYAHRKLFAATSVAQQVVADFDLLVASR
jgi:glycosyltransferase involved in cell wall biosynthesis